MYVVLRYKYPISYIGQAKNPNCMLTMLNTLTFIVFLLLALPGHSCPHAEDSSSFPSKDALEIARSNNERRGACNISR
jgi:hypothetical protein